jgi:hypothetical protein
MQKQPILTPALAAELDHNSLLDAERPTAKGANRSESAIIAASVSRIGFHDRLPAGIRHRDHNGCLMNVEPNILFTVDKGAPFRR